MGDIIQGSEESTLITAPTSAVEQTEPAPGPTGPSESTTAPSATGATGAAQVEPEPQPKERDGAKFAALHKRELELRKREDEIKRAEEESQRARADRETWAKDLAAAKEDPLAFIQKHLGLDFETLARRHVLREPDVGSSEKVDPKVASIEKDLAELKAAREAEEAKAKERSEAEAKRQTQELIQAHLREKLEFCKAHSDDFELVLSNPEQAAQMYLDLYAQSFRAAGRDLEPEEQELVLRRTEQLLTEREEKRIQLLEKTKRFGGRFAPKTQPQSTEEKQEPGHPAAKTLTNDMPSRTPAATSPVVANRPARASLSPEMSPRDRVAQEALARVAAKFARTS